MSKEVLQLGPQEKRFDLVKEGFFFSGGSNVGHALFICFIARKLKVNPIDALKFYNNSYATLTPEYKDKLTSQMLAVHKPETKSFVNSVLLTSAHPAVRNEISAGKLKMDKLYTSAFIEELPQIKYFDDLDLKVIMTFVETRENLNIVLDHIIQTYDQKRQTATLKTVAAFLGCFDKKNWFIRIPENKRRNFKLLGENLCRVALSN